MPYVSHLHLDILARGALRHGEPLLGAAVTTHRPWWALGFVQRTCVLLATPWRLILLEHESSLELTAAIAIPWQDVEELTLRGLFATQLRLRARTQKGLIARTLKVPRDHIDGAREVADAFDNGRARAAAPRLRLVPPSEAIDFDVTLPFKRQGTSLEGTWRLLAVEGRSDGRTLSTPFGPHPIGQLVYMRDGRMSVMIMAAARAKFGSHGLRAGTGAEKAAAFDSFLAYSGRYERLEDRVIHHPDVASIPDFVGVPEERFVTLEGDRLVLSTPPMLEDGRLRTFVVIWQRASAPAHAGATMRMSRAALYA